MQNIKVNRKRFIVSMVIYSIMVFVTIFLVQSIQAPWSYIAAFLPTIPALFALNYYMNWMRASDELVRLQALESVAYGAIFSIIVFITWSFLEAAGAPRMRAPMALLVLMASYFVASLVVDRRYQ